MPVPFVLARLPPHLLLPLRLKYTLSLLVLAWISRLEPPFGGRGHRRDTPHVHEIGLMDDHLVVREHIIRVFGGGSSPYWPAFLPPSPPWLVGVKKVDPRDRLDG